ncbi:MAG TPA: hypothetical protein VFE62_19775 [Gemmataceae bacterium]|nr:hypothetical protein [Gemmataceae bacterium]
MRIIVETVWSKLGWTTPWESIAGLRTAYVLSLGTKHSMGQ